MSRPRPELLLLVVSPRDGAQDFPGNFPAGQRGLLVTPLVIVWVMFASLCRSDIHTDSKGGVYIAGPFSFFRNGPALHAAFVCSRRIILGRRYLRKINLTNYICPIA